MASTVGIYPVECQHCGRAFDGRFRYYLRLAREDVARRQEGKEGMDNAELLDRAGLYDCCRKLALVQPDEPVGEPLEMRTDLKSNRLAQKATGRFLVASSSSASAGEGETKGETKKSSKPRVYQLTPIRAWEAAVKKYKQDLKAGRPATVPDKSLMPISDRISRGAAVEEVTAPEFRLEAAEQEMENEMALMDLEEDA